MNPNNNSPYNKPGEQATRAYSAAYPTSSTDPAYRRDYEEYPGEQHPEAQWGAPRKPQPMNLPRFAVSAAIVAGLAAAIAWALTTLTNTLPAATGGATVLRDPEAAAIGTGLLTVVSAAILVGLVYNGARPGLIFICLAGALVIVLLVWAWTQDSLNSWQSWISIGVLNSLLVLAVAGVLYALGRATVNITIVKDY